MGGSNKQYVKKDDNVYLLKSVEDIEVKAAIFHVRPEKFLDPDDMIPAFYQKIWSIVDNDVVRLVKKNKLIIANSYLHELIKMLYHPEKKKINCNARS